MIYRGSVLVGPLQHLTLVGWMYGGMESEDGLFRSCETLICIRSPHKHDNLLVLEIGANDLFELTPEVEGFAIQDLVCIFHKTYGVKIVAVSESIHRCVWSVRFNHSVDVLNQYFRVVLEPLDFAFLLQHRGLQKLFCRGSFAAIAEQF